MDAEGGMLALVTYVLVRGFVPRSARMWSLWKQATESEPHTFPKEHSDG